MRRRFFISQFEGGGALLRGEKAQHLGRVLRAEAGQLYELSDGREVWLGRVERVTKESVQFALVERVPVPVPRLKITLLLSVVKYDRFEWALEKATELGVHRIVPVAAARSEKGLVAGAAKRSERWEKLLAEAGQQSRRLAPPELEKTARLRDALGALGSESLRVLLSERAGAALLREILTKAPHAAEVVLAIGPEGGWTEPEFDTFTESGFQEASLGPWILRTETAVLAGLAAVQYALGEPA